MPVTTTTTTTKEREREKTNVQLSFQESKGNVQRQETNWEPKNQSGQVQNYATATLVGVRKVLSGLSD